MRRFKYLEKSDQQCRWYSWHVIHSDTLNLCSAISDTLIAKLSDTHSLTICLWWSLICSLACSLTGSLWHFNSPKCNDNLIRNNPLDNTMKHVCICHHQSVVHISVYTPLPLESISLTGANERWSIYKGYPRIYHTIAIECCYQDTVASLPILTKLSFHLHAYLSSSSIFAMSWETWSEF